MKTEQEQIDREQVRKPSREQVIIEGLITTLGYREQRIDELEAELITWKTRAEIAERRNKYLLKKLEEVQNGEDKG